eukprot:2160671-Prymnesium_polylepis.1
MHSHDERCEWCCVHRALCEWPKANARAPPGDMSSGGTSAAEGAGRGRAVHPWGRAAPTSAIQ